VHRLEYGWRSPKAQGASAKSNKRESAREKDRQRQRDGDREKQRNKDRDRDRRTDRDRQRKSVRGFPKELCTTCVNATDSITSNNQLEIESTSITNSFRFSLKARSWACGMKDTNEFSRGSFLIVKKPTMKIRKDNGSGEQRENDQRHRSGCLLERQWKAHRSHSRKSDTHLTHARQMARTMILLESGVVLQRSACEGLQRKYGVAQALVTVNNMLFLQ
jgi:glucan-binding YG repeat protein